MKFQMFIAIIAPITTLFGIRMSIAMVKNRASPGTMIIPSLY